MDRARHLGLRGGRGFAIVVWSNTVASLIMLLVLWLVASGIVGSEIISGSLPAYFGMVGVVAGAYQGKNIAEGWRSGRPEDIPEES